MPIYEYYCPNNHTIYQFYAKTLAQGEKVPRCPDNPKFRMRRMVSTFAVTGRHKESEAQPGGEAGTDPAEDARMEAAMQAMESEFAHVDENDPRAMARMMRRMAELTGEKIDGEMEEVVRKLEEGADPESLEEEWGGGDGGEEDPYGEGMGGPPAGDAQDTREGKFRFRIRRAAPHRDERLHDYED
jgi:hypothetical protein